MSFTTPLTMYQAGGAPDLYAERGGGWNGDCRRQGRRCGVSRRRSILAHPVLLYGTAAAAALLSALGEQTIAHLWGEGWNWVDFGQDVLANGVIAFVLAVVTRALQKEQDRVAEDRAALEEKAAAQRREQAERARLLGLVALPLAVSGWSKVPPEPGSAPVQQTLTPGDLEDLARQTSDWRKLADDLNTIVTSRPPDDAGAEQRSEAGQIAYLVLTQVRSELQLYLMEGGRRRRLIYLQSLSSDLATAASAGWSWSPAAYRLRNAAVVLFGWVQHTDTTIVERLLVEQVTGLFHGEPPPSQWRDSSNGDRLPDAAVNADPVYLLVFHINRACARIEQTRQFADTIPLVKLLARSLGALRNEMRSAADCSDALLALARDGQDTLPHLRDDRQAAQDSTPRCPH
jgi:hypothetical protein